MTRGYHTSKRRPVSGTASLFRGKTSISRPFAVGLARVSMTRNGRSLSPSLPLQKDVMDESKNLTEEACVLHGNRDHELVRVHKRYSTSTGRRLGEPSLSLPHLDRYDPGVWERDKNTRHPKTASLFFARRFKDNNRS